LQAESRLADALQSLDDRARGQFPMGLVSSVKRLSQAFADHAIDWRLDVNRADRRIAALRV
jgi:hypothetical protein